MKANRARHCLSFQVHHGALVFALSSLFCLSLHAQSDAGAPAHSDAGGSGAKEERPEQKAKGRAAVDAGILGLQAKIEPDPVVFGETFHLVIEVKHPPELQVDLPSKVPERPAVPQVGQIRSETGTANKTTNGTAGPEPGPADVNDPSIPVLTRFRIPFLALGLEDVKTPSLVLRTSEGELIEIPELPVPVRSEDEPENPATAGGQSTGPATTVAQGDSLRLEQAPGPIVFSVFDDRPLWFLLAGLFIAVVYWLYRRFAVRKVAVEPKTPPPPKRPPHEVALERLDALLAEGLLARGEVNPFITRLMDEVLREFLEERFAVAAGRRTTRELMESLLDTSAQGLDVPGTRAVLEQADLVKFARATLAADAAHEMAERVRALIVATTTALSPDVPDTDAGGGAAALGENGNQRPERGHS